MQHLGASQWKELLKAARAIEKTSSMEKAAKPTAEPDRAGTRAESGRSARTTAAPDAKAAAAADLSANAETDAQDTTIAHKESSSSILPMTSVCWIVCFFFCFFFSTDFLSRTLTLTLLSTLSLLTAPTSQDSHYAG